MQPVLEPEVVPTFEYIPKGIKSGQNIEKNNNDEISAISSDGLILINNTINSQNSAQTEMNSAKEESTLKLMSNSFPSTKLNSSLSFEWTDLDFSRVVPCGCSKCFFRNISNKSTGYVIQYYGAEKGMDRLLKTWHYSKYLEHTYGARHFVLGPPVHMNITKNTAKLLNTNLEDTCLQPQQEKEKQGKSKKAKLMFQRKVTAQKNLVAPQSALMFGSNVRYFRHMKSRMEILLGLTKDRQAFAERLRKEWNKVLSMMRKEKKLCFDFQIMIDDRGKIYHFDIDRVYIEQNQHQHKLEDFMMKSELGVAFAQWIHNITI